MPNAARSAPSRAVGWNGYDLCETNEDLHARREAHEAPGQA